jgi:NADPH:quinone reductase-like Zn-dependent oxidoreductase
MKAIVLQSFGSVDNFQPQNIPLPVIKDNEVLVQVKAISINPVDAKTRMGKGISGRFKDQSPIILGWDIAGIVTATGKDVSQFKEGDEVFGMVNFPGIGNAYAEYIAAPAAHLAIKPSNITFAEAAAATLAALTAYQALTQKLTIKHGNKVLIHAAAGGVGHYAVQIAAHYDAYVIGTSSAANKDFVLSLGADEHIDYKTQSLVDTVADIDIVLDTIGGNNIDNSLEVIKPGGTIISIPSGLNETVVEKAKAKNINGFFFLVASNGEDMQNIAQLLQQGIIHSHISRIFSFDEIPEAHQQIESGKTKGKIVIAL